MPDTTPTNPALTAARTLATAGHHAHYVDDAEQRCLTGLCGNPGLPTPRTSRANTGRHTETVALPN